MVLELRGEAAAGNANWEWRVKEALAKKASKTPVIEEVEEVSGLFS